MVRYAVLLSTLCLACSSDEPSASVLSVAAKRPASLMEELSWLPSNMHTVTRFRRGTFGLLEWLGGEMGGRKAECWRRVEAGIEAAYMLDAREGPSNRSAEPETDPLREYWEEQKKIAMKRKGGEGGESREQGRQREERRAALDETEKIVEVTVPRGGNQYLAFRGALDRTSVERCAQSAFPPGHALHALVVRDGDLTRIETAAGTALLWWRGDGWVIAGTAAEIEAARLADGSLTANKCLVRLLGVFPDQPMAAASCLPHFENLLGVPTRGWVVGAAAVPKERLDGRVTVFYASAGDASRARAAWASRSFAAFFPDPISDFLASLPVSVQGDRLHVELRFDKTDIAALEKMDIAELQKQMSAPPEPR
jgi:hypothetical protein